ncbi:hypothetical protein [Streptomyces sp. Je 1-369]|uniref:hypothetical protein n=1 Tax=Streptomyces sp. Je 1-369 TaxID=2966192 RepID=UPI0022856B45|nr:hypothetical protein [Streptomyces sp. Je 1-369]WAL96129.1 hypothetical protein NOO62_17515 [Streptomyces sp. Je 1-369]
MTRTKKILVTLAVAAAAVSGTAGPALADSHQSVATPFRDGHAPTTPQGDGHAPTPPLG